MSFPFIAEIRSRDEEKFDMFFFKNCSICSPNKTIKKEKKERKKENQ